MPRKTHESMKLQTSKLEASMRPRPDAAENSAAAAARAPGASGFNEAAARCRGKRDFRIADGTTLSRLQ